jgi:hypothetical protein
MSAYSSIFLQRTFAELWPLLLTILSVGFVLLVGIALTVLLIALVYRHHRRKLTVERWLDLHNLGNTVSVFHLRPDSGGVRVSSVLLADDRPLAFASVPAPQPQRPAVQPAPVAQTAPQPRPAAQSAEQPAPVQPQAAPQSAPQPSAAAEAAKKAKKEAKTGINTARKAGGILGALGSLLPGEAGRAFKDKSTLIQTTTQKASLAIEEPEHKKRELQHIQHEISSLGGKKQESAGKAAESAAAPAAQASTTLDAPVVQPAPVQAPAPVVSAPVQPRWITLRDTFQTPPVKPAGSQRIRLLLKPANLFKTGSVPFCLQSKQLIEDENGILQQVNSAETRQQIAVPGLPLYKSIVTILLALLIAAANAWWMVVVIKWLTALVGKIG